MNRTRLTLPLAFACAAGLAAPAAADETSGTYEKDQWPLAATRRPLTLAGGMVEVRGDTLGVNLSSDRVGDPVFLAPDVFYGVSDKLSIGITEQQGFCLAGEVACADKKYNDLGLEAQYAILQAGNLYGMARAALALPSLSDPTVAGLDLGLAFRVIGGPVGLQFEPSLYVGAVGREPDEATDPAYVALPGWVGPKETFRLPVDVQYQLNFQTMVFLSTGVNGPLDGFGDAYAVPLGIGALFAINNRMDLGAELEFLDVLGKKKAAYDRGDLRLLWLRFALRI